ncbi:MAG: hypothetical protein WD058_07385 [Dehalococcoidia bacterium]
MLLGVLSGAVLTLALGVAGASTAGAQLAAPFTAYGVGVPAGATVEAFVAGQSCGTAVADAAGNWLLPIAPTAPCAPKDGSAITFRLNGQATTGEATFSTGGAPEDVVGGIPLEVVAGGSGTFLGPIGPGVNLQVFTGGTIEEAVAAAPNAQSFFISSGGVLVSYVVGAPSFVNAAFFEVFAGGVIAANTPMLVVA